MSNSLMIIEHPGTPFGSALEELLRFAEVPVGRRDAWASFLPAHLSSCRESLLLANAVPESEQALQFFHWLRDHPIPVPTFAILPRKDGDLLQAAVGAVDDFLLLPVHPEELRLRLARLLGPRTAQWEEVESLLVSELGLRQLVGKDPAFLRALTQVALFGSSEAPVLLTGETGTGKELFARGIHLLSKRRSGPFIPVDCGSVPDHLFENELFGHARGAFTDARSNQKGLVAIAHGGTLFMDELDGLSPAAQGKVLRLLQENTYRPLGAEQFRSANVRVIAATNEDLVAMVRNKQFRQDLYFRINVLRVHLPALRERPLDIPLLARHFVEEICQASGLPRKVLSQTAVRRLESHDWPGNVRELYNTVQRAALCASGQQIAAVHIDLLRPSPASDESREGFRKAKVHAIETFERIYVERMLLMNAGNITQAARESGKDRRGFGRLVKKYSLRRRA